ncbi:MAG: hypothetical protein D3916_09670 [Candidatus Electrothrix sp. MAN1_4]|nr:hypothetical protein [Candidatus Electrothrix sp. MAN1_4]
MIKWQILGIGSVRFKIHHYDVPRKQALDQTGLSPNFIMTTVLKGAFTAVSAVPAGRINSVKDFLFSPNYRLISDELNRTSARFNGFRFVFRNFGLFLRLCKKSYTLNRERTKKLYASLLALKIVIWSSLNKKYHSVVVINNDNLKIIYCFPVLN